MKLSILVLLVGLLVFPIEQCEAQNSLSWNENRKLTWNDFKARAHGGEPEDVALTTYQIGYSYKIMGSRIEVDVYCHFIKNQSWVKPEGRNDYVLLHEQKHFDLAEIYARKLKAAFREYAKNGMSRRYVERDMERIYNEIWDECSEMQERYDHQTRHGLNKKQQAEWNEKIKEALIQN